MGMATSKVRLNICGSSYVVNTSESEDTCKTSPTALIWT